MGCYTVGRPRKTTVDYFPHFVRDGKTKFILQSTWGNDGYAFWFKLLELLSKSEGQAFNCSVALNKQYLCAYMRIPEETVDAILNCLVEIGKIDRELWEKQRIIWCQRLVDNLQGLYSKRAESSPEKPEINEKPERKGATEAITEPESTDEATERPDNKPQESGMEVSVEGIGDSAQEASGPDEQPDSTRIEKEKTKSQRKPRKKKDEPEKKSYGEFIQMTEEEYQKLLNLHGPEKTARMIEVLDNYKGSNGKTYANDYRAILNWVVERVEEEYAKKGGSSYGWSNGNQTDHRGTGDNGGFVPSGGFRNGA